MPASAPLLDPPSVGPPLDAPELEPLLLLPLLEPLLEPPLLLLPLLVVVPLLVVPLPEVPLLEVPLLDAPLLAPDPFEPPPLPLPPPLASPASPRVPNVAVLLPLHAASHTPAATRPTFRAFMSFPPTSELRIAHSPSCSAGGACSPCAANHYRAFPAGRATIAV